MKDAFDVELKVGDIVAAVYAIRNSISVYKCEVVGFTPKMVRIGEVNTGEVTAKNSRNLIKLS